MKTFYFEKGGNNKSYQRFIGSHQMHWSFGDFVQIVGFCLTMPLWCNQIMCRKSHYYHVPIVSRHFSAFRNERILFNKKNLTRIRFSYHLNSTCFYDFFFNNMRSNPEALVCISIKKILYRWMSFIGFTSEQRWTDAGISNLMLKAFHYFSRYCAHFGLW